MFVLAGIVCGFLLNLSHMLFSFYLQCRYLKFLLFKCLYSLSNHFIHKSRKYNSEAKYIERTIKGYSKIPKHLTFALGEERISYEDLVQIILWSLPSGIAVLSFYDHRSELNPKRLYEAFQRCHEDLVPLIKWGVSFSIDDVNEAVGKSPHLQVNVLDGRHSRQLLIDSVKELCHKKDANLVDRATTEAALDDVMFSKMAYCGNPDLLVINGNVYTTYGLSPWHIGFTEFQITPCYRLLTLYDFLKILKSYADCDQKFGR